MPDKAKVVFEKCKGGNYKELSGMLNCVSRKDRKLIVSRKQTDGCTPLIISCKHGNLDIVKYLVKECDADVHQTGSIMFDGELVEGVPPLWCAAAAGKLEIVRFLVVNASANVNQTTLTNSTALRAACFDGHMPVVEFLVRKKADVNIPNRHGHTCLMISCFKGYEQIVRFLLLNSANVDSTSLKGNTALHDCAESGNIECMKLLIESGARQEPDEYGQTPIMSAGNAGYEDIVEYLSNDANVKREEVANAYELLGAYYYDRALAVDKTYKAWRRALGIRIPSNESALAPLKKKLPCDTKEAYEFEKEFETRQDLEQVIADPLRTRMQTLLIRERVLGPTHPDTSYHIRYRGAIFADSGQVGRCIQLWLYALDMQLSHLEPLSLVTQTCFLSFAELFAYVLTAPDHFSNQGDFIDFRLVQFVLAKCVDNLYRSLEYTYPNWHRRRPWAYSHSDKEATNFMRQVVLCLHFIGIVLKFFWNGRPAVQSRSSANDSAGAAAVTGSPLSAAERDGFRRLVYRFVRSHARVHRSYTILHMACLKQSSKMGRYPVVRFPNVPVIRLLLEVGADPNELDVDCCSPLHVVAAARPRDLSAENRGAILQALVSHGGHLDQWSKRKRNVFLVLPKEFPLHSYVDVAQATSLKCLCARLVRRLSLPYSEPGALPVELVDFVDKH